MLVNSLDFLKETAIVDFLQVLSGKPVIKILVDDLRLCSNVFIVTLLLHISIIKPNHSSLIPYQKILSYTVEP